MEQGLPKFSMIQTFTNLDELRIEDGSWSKFETVIVHQTQMKLFYHPLRVE